jgi:hypothetical protein
MAIFGLSEDLDLTIQNKEDKSIVPMFESERVDEEIRSYIAGYKWEVTYFHRNITESDLVTEYDPNLDPALQSYNRIDNFIINVDQPLDQELMNGSGIIDLTEPVNTNDLFIAKISDGKSVIFNITNVEKVDYNNDKVFKVDYSAYGEITGLDDPQLTTLLKSTVNEVTFNKDFRRTKTQPFYTKSEVTDRKTFYKLMNDLISMWSDKFINQDTNFYMCYIQDGSVTYDPQMETFIKDTIGTDSLTDKLEIIEVNDRKVSILDLIVREDIGRARVNKYLSTRDTKDDTVNPYLNSLSYIQVDEILDVSKYSVYEKTDTTINAYFPKVETEHYIFRKQVYDAILNPELIIDHVTHTKFEQLLIATLNGDTIRKETIMELYDNIFDLPDEEQFYFIPILTYIMKYYLTTFTINFL